MLVLGAAVHDYVLAIHIIAVIVAFGVLFIYPLLGLVGARLGPRGMAAFHRVQSVIHDRIQAPGLVVVVAAGIYLASDLHVWSEFFVAWGIAASIVIGGIGGAYIAPREKRLIALAEKEAAMVPAGGVEGFAWSEEYRTAARQADAARLVQLALTVLTIFFMALRL